MSEAQHRTLQTPRLAPRRRALLLVRLLASVGLTCGLVALVTGGAIRSGFAAAAVVLLLTAGLSAVAVWHHDRRGEVRDIHEPPPVIRLPPSPVTQLEDLGARPQPAEIESRPADAQRDP